MLVRCRRIRNCHRSTSSLCRSYFQQVSRLAVFDHCWQWRPQCILQMLEIELSPCHVRHVCRFSLDVPLCLEEGLFNLGRSVLVLRVLPTSVLFLHSQVNAVILYHRVIHDDFCCSPALAFELSQKANPLPVLMQRCCRLPESKIAFPLSVRVCWCRRRKTWKWILSNRGSTAVSSSTLSHSLAMVSSHARLRYKL